MLRFADILQHGFADRPTLNSRVWHPPVIFGRLSALLGRSSEKWLGYVDQYLVAPLSLLIVRGRHRGARYHICDHSNAPFAAVLPATRTSITCHDVIAIEAAAGHRAHGVTPSRLGGLQQAYIRHYLVRQRRVACSSANTLERLRHLRDSPESPPGWSVVPQSIQDGFAPIPWSGVLESDHGLRRGKYLFHLGSNHPRKNRPLLLKMLARLREEEPWWQAAFAGEGPSAAELHEVNALGVVDHVVWIGGVTHETACELYTHCFAFVFPSLAEGFGLPPVEAQACGAPVVSSNRAPMPEVCGEGAIYADPTDLDAFLRAVQSLRDPAFRQNLVQRGSENAIKYDGRNVMSLYETFITEKTETQGRSSIEPLL